MQLPESSRIEGMCAKLNKCIYALKQLPSAWYHCLTDYLVSYSFTVSTFDPYVLIYKQHDHNQTGQDIHLFIVVYVDDLFLFGSKGQLMDSVKDLLK